MSRPPMFSAADLQRGAKGLNQAPEAKDSNSSSSSSSSGGGVDEGEREALDRLEQLYERHNGDLDLM